MVEEVLLSALAGCNHITLTMQFGIDWYDIRRTAHDNCMWPMYQHVLAVITVSENLNNVQRNTTSTATIAAVNQCGYYLYYHHSYMW